MVLRPPPILYFGSVMHTGILDIPVLYLCFGMLSYAYLAFALGKFVYLRSRKFALNVKGTTRFPHQGGGFTSQ